MGKNKLFLLLFRFYSKFHKRRMEELNNTGLCQFIGLFLTLSCVADFEDVVCLTNSVYYRNILLSDGCHRSKLKVINSKHLLVIEIDVSLWGWALIRLSLQANQLRMMEHYTEVLLDVLQYINHSNTDL